MTFANGLRLVKQARRKADKVRRLLRKLGDTDESRPLGARFRRMQRRLESGAANEVTGDIFAELGLAMHKLDLLAHEKFYTQAAVSR